MQQREALSEQIRVHKEAAINDSGKPNVNPYGRSESLMALYQKEKAKELFKEQLAIVQQRKNYEAKVAEIEKHHSLQRISLARQE